MGQYTCHYCGQSCSMMGHAWCMKGITREEYYKPKQVTLYPIGSRLMTKDGRKYSNGIIIGYHSGQVVSYQIESDFGNIFFKLASEVDNLWYVDDSDPDTIRWHEERDALRSRSLEA